jgi:hypothetical protein
MARERRDWELASGPTVGGEVPVTSDPRDEDAPGVPSRGRAGRERGDHGGRQRGASSRGDLETRAVEVEEPQLSPEVNARLTEEVRDVVGSDRVEVPRDRPHPSRGEQVNRTGVIAYLGTQRPMVLGTFAGALVIGAIIALISNTWWVLPLAAGVHAFGTMIVVAIVLRMTTTIEHPSPELAATLAEEGVRNPDEHFTRLVDEFSPQSRAETADIASPANERPVTADAPPAADEAQQATALSPNAGPSRPVRGGGTPDWIIWTVAIALFAVSIAIPAAMGGGAMWFLTAVMVPALVGWVLFQREMAVHGNDLHLRGRKPVAVIVGCTVAVVAVFCAVVALAFSH